MWYAEKAGKDGKTPLSFNGASKDFPARRPLDRKTTHNRHFGVRMW